MSEENEIVVAVYQTHIMGVDYPDGSSKTYYRHYDGKWEVDVVKDGKIVQGRAHNYKVLEDLFKVQIERRVVGAVSSKEKSVDFV